ncbi:MAG: DivIVA domain-containing protein [Erysipelotrichaceae bacterium]
MEAKKPKFRIMKQGYDRFAVDDAFDRIQFDLDAKEKQLQSYSKQIEFANEQLDLIKERYQSLVSELNVREKAADDIARLALREANTVISSAQSNADSILKEALSSAKLVLTEIARISKDAQGLREDMLQKVHQLTESIEAFQVPKIPAVSYINDKDKEQDEPVDIQS